MKINMISESKTQVSDNEVSSLKHHVHDALNALKTGDRAVLVASLKDIMEIAEDLESRFSSVEQKEI